MSWKLKKKYNDVLADEEGYQKKIWGELLKVCLAYPNYYRTGMPNLGFQTVYSLINREKSFLCERVFLPDPEDEAAFASGSIPLFSLESQKALTEFDIIAFSIPFENDYPGILKMLSMAGITLFAGERKEKEPLIIGGGVSVTLNPEPLADFIDAFCIGDGEELAVEVTDKLTQLKAEGLDRETILCRLAREVPGVYVPRFYRFDYGSATGRQDACATISGVTRLRDGLPLPVRRRAVASLETAPFPVAPIVPLVETVHERFTVEIMRGCINGCRFCQAGMITRPRRQRSQAEVLRLAQEGCARTGYDEIGLLSLSSSDYAGITELARKLNDCFAAQGVSVSLPSLRVGAALAALPEEMSRTRKSGLTVAPEAGSERLRNIINKPVKDEHLLEGCRQAYLHGFDHVKLYFMLGLPGETDDDLRAIGQLSGRIALERTKLGKGPAKVAASVSNFVAKAHTPFQWEALPPREEWRRRQHIVRSSTRVKAVTLKFHNPDTSYLECVLARGDRRLGPVIETAWRNGARFDGWEEHLKLDVWLAAFKECGVDPDWHGLRGREPTEILPWSVISSGVSTEFLARERERSRQGVATPCSSEGPLETAGEGG
ncbi:MAG: TIGR03960 family B12-binding radical SAM protein [Planctomycetota bacterium]